MKLFNTFVRTYLDYERVISGVAANTHKNRLKISFKP